MAAFVALLCFLLILNQSSDLVGASSVTETCKAVAADDPNINYDFCVATLSADPGSTSADTQGLAIIATKLTNANATSTESTISILLKNTKDDATKACLGDCSSLYSDVTDSMDDAISAIQSKRYFDAGTYVSLATVVGIECESRFEVKKIKSPLTKENNDLRAVSKIALAIIDRLG